MQVVSFFTHIKQFFAMGGYAFYVWSAYILAIGILGCVYVQACLRVQRVTRLIEQQNNRDNVHEC